MKKMDMVLGETYYVESSLLYGALNTMKGATPHRLLHLGPFRYSMSYRETSPMVTLEDGTNRRLPHGYSHGNGNMALFEVARQRWNGTPEKKLVVVSLTSVRTTWDDMLVHMEAEQQRADEHEASVSRQRDAFEEKLKALPPSIDYISTSPRDNVLTIDIDVLLRALS